MPWRGGGNQNGHNKQTVNDMKTELGTTYCDACSATVNSFMRTRRREGYVDKDMCNCCYESRLQTQCKQLQTQREQSLTELFRVRANISAAAIQRAGQAARAKQQTETAT